MSTIKSDNIATLAGVTTSMANAVNGSAKAWVNFNGTGTVAIRASYNVTSITDNGTGDYTVNFTNAMSDANYSVSAVPSPAAASSARMVCQVFTNSGGITTVAPSTSAFRLAAFNMPTATNYDPDYICVAIFR